MLESIEIKGFRCFEDLRVKGFRRINLIGGKNNSGKTCLLEAILLGTSPSSATIACLNGSRNIDSDFMKARSDSAWDYFFFDQDKSRTAKICSIPVGGDGLEVTFWCDEAFDSFEKISDSTAFGSGSGRHSVLHVKVKKSNEDRQFDLAVSDTHISISEPEERGVPSAKLLSASANRSNVALAESFDKIERSGQGQHVLDFVKMIDPEIEAVRAYSIGKARIYLKILPLPTVSNPGRNAWKKTAKPSPKKTSTNSGFPSITALTAAHQKNGNRPNANAATRFL